MYFINIVYSQVSKNNEVLIYCINWLTGKPYNSVVGFWVSDEWVHYPMSLT